jgi:hypothetical protein
MNKKESATNTDSEALLLGSLQLLQEYRWKTERIITNIYNQEMLGGFLVFFFEGI